MIYNFVNSFQDKSINQRDKLICKICKIYMR